MPINGLTATEIIGTAAGGGVLGGAPVGRTSLELANDAGRRLMSVRSWRWAEGARVQLGFTASVPFVALPSDYYETLSVKAVESVADHFEEVTRDFLLERVTTTPTGGPPLYGVVVWDSTQPGMPVPRYDLYPTPDSTVANALNLYYRRKWFPFPDPADSTEAKIPDWMEPLFIEFLRAVGLGWEDTLSMRTPAMTDQYLATVLRGATYQGAVTQDTRTQAAIGVPRNGMYGARNVRAYQPPVSPP